MQAYAAAAEERVQSRRDSEKQEAITIHNFYFWTKPPQWINTEWGLDQ